MDLIPRITHTALVSERACEPGPEAHGKTSTQLRGAHSPGQPRASAARSAVASQLRPAAGTMSIAVPSPWVL